MPKSDDISDTSNIYFSMMIFAWCPDTNYSWTQLCQTVHDKTHDETSLTHHLYLGSRRKATNVGATFLHDVMTKYLEEDFVSATSQCARLLSACRELKHVTFKFAQSKKYLSSCSCCKLVLECSSHTSLTYYCIQGSSSSSSTVLQTTHALSQRSTASIKQK